MTADFSNAARVEIMNSIEFAVQFNRAGKATNAGRDYAAAALAGRVLEHLERCGCVIFKKALRG